MKYDVNGRVIMTVEQVNQDARIHQKRGAERERRRIRRLMRGWVHIVRGFIATVPVTSAANALALDALNRIDYSTRAPRAKRRRG